MKRCRDLNVQYNLEQIEKQLKTHCEKGNISTLPNVIAVTKYVTIDRANDAYHAGIRHFGENRLEGFQLKKEALPDDIVMHFIGSLQTRKVKEVINEIDYFHALDRLKLAKEINKRAEHKIKCFVQVNVSGEKSKQGVALEDVNTFIETLEQYENLEVVGLMTMAPLTDDESYIKSLFQSLRNKRDEIKALNLNYAPCTRVIDGNE